MPGTLVSVHQPNFMPWLRLLDKILASDVFVAYDTAQYTKTEYHARQKVKAPAGTGTTTAWLSAPLLHIKGTRQLLKDVRLDNSQPFRKRHRTLLRNAYRKAPYFDEVFPLIEKVYALEHEYLVDLSLDLIAAIRTYLNSPVRIVRASTLPHEGDKAERLLQLVQNAGGTAHLTSTYGGDHQAMDWELFRTAGMPLLSQEFDHPEYEQAGGGEFEPNLAAIDMLFACGPQTADILANRRRLVPVDLDSAIHHAADNGGGDPANDAVKERVY